MATQDSTAQHTGSAATSNGRVRKPGLILAFVCIAQFMVFLDVTIVNVALPTIGPHLDVPELWLQYIITAYGIVLGGFLLLGGRLADTFGRRLLLQVGLVVFALASLTAGAAQSAEVLILARGIQGLGAAFIAPAALSILTNTFSEGTERNRALGIWGALTGIASVTGVLLGGALTEGPGWRWIFLINVPVGIVAAILAPLVVPESRDASRRRPFDTAGAVVLTAGLLLFIYTLGETVEVGWLSARTIISLVVAALLLIGFVVIEQRVTSPLIPFSIFRLKVLRTANIATVLLFGSTAGLFFFASLYMQLVLEYSPLETGLAYVPLAVAVSVGAGFASSLVTKVDAKPVLTVGLVLAAVGLLLLWRLPLDAGYATRILPAFVIVGLGLGTSFVTLQIAAFVGVREEQSGLAAGLVNTSQEGGGAVGVAVIATIAFSTIKPLRDAANGDDGLIKEALASGFHVAFLVGASFALASLVLALVLLPSLSSPDRTEVSTHGA